MEGRRNLSEVICNYITTQYSCILLTRTNSLSDNAEEAIELFKDYMIKEDLINNKCFIGLNEIIIRAWTEYGKLIKEELINLEILEKDLR
jgi:hypothetical protein